MTWRLVVLALWCLIVVPRGYPLGFGPLRPEPTTSAGRAG